MKRKESRFVKRTDIHHIIIGISYVMGLATIFACSTLSINVGTGSTTPEATTGFTLPSDTATLPIPSATPTISEPSATPFPIIGVGSTWSRPADGSVMMFVPESEFIMGSDLGADFEGPEHIVYLDAFWIDRTEVTNAMFADCVDKKVCKDPGTSNRSSEYDDHPVSTVAWDDAFRYCVWVGARLPTEAEWEKAARGPDGRLYPWGNELDEKRYYLETEGQTSIPLNKPVGTYLEGASPYGVLDMAGGVFEWVNDFYSPSYYQKSPESNPSGPPDGNKHVIRGGDYVDYDLRTFTRYSGGSSFFRTLKNLGFRCARDANP
ncbi:MAG: SUMF1/EgtB/PvdO family nonheme iron enzyme [Anaerolineales bacterium]|nr:SUMF1/EgtB/PvdO family nonheme iron enzyme [Anaerolineales bacterium]